MMKRSKLWLPLSAAAMAGGLVLFAAQAPAEPVGAPAAEAPAKVKAKPKKCLNGGNYDQQIVDNSTLILTDRFNTSVQVKVKGCHLNDMDPLMFEFRGSTQVCNPIDLDMSTVTTTGGFKTKCFVQSITQIKQGTDDAAEG
jgi:hypothetical protein